MPVSFSPMLFALLALALMVTAPAAVADLEAASDSVPAASSAAANEAARVGQEAVLDLLEVPSELASAELQVEEVDPLRMSVDITRYLVQRVKPNLERTGRFENLMDAVFGSDGLEIEYGNARTKTAVETFEERSGNCLSFTFLFVAMSRHVGIPAYFQEVEEVLSWDRRGDVLVSNRHMFARVELNNARINVDFLPGAEKSYRFVRRIGDRRATAHFYNNRGVEALAAGDLVLSIGYFQRALSQDPELAAIWANRGVALRRLGHPRHAEASYERALELDDDEPTARANLAALWIQQGKEEQAQPLLDAIEDHRRRNPFHHFRLGATAGAKGNLQQALGHYRTAIRRDPDHAVFYLAMAEALQTLGDATGAQEAYEDALERSETPEQRERVREAIARLNTLQGVEESSSRN